MHTASKLRLHVVQHQNLLYYVLYKSRMLQFEQFLLRNPEKLFIKVGDSYALFVYYVIDHYLTYSLHTYTDSAHDTSGSPLSEVYFTALYRQCCLMHDNPRVASFSLCRIFYLIFKDGFWFETSNL